MGGANLSNRRLQEYSDDNYKARPEVTHLSSPNQKTTLGKLCMSLSRQAAGGFRGANVSLTIHAWCLSLH